MPASATRSSQICRVASGASRFARFGWLTVCPPISLPSAASCLTWLGGVGPGRFRWPRGCPADLVAVGGELLDLAGGQAPGLVELAAVDVERGVHPVPTQLRQAPPDAPQ